MLGAPTTPSGGVGAEAATRLAHALALVADGGRYAGATLVLSGGAPRTYGSGGLISEADAMAHALEQLVGSRVREVRTLGARSEAHLHRLAEDHTHVRVHDVEPDALGDVDFVRSRPVDLHARILERLLHGLHVEGQSTNLWFLPPNVGTQRRYHRATSEGNGFRVRVLPYAP